ncbi:MAG: acyl-CoA synthetase [Rubrivivax sp.]|nr:acyl-CoA synthetase [Rubrivivax sp.]
MGTAVNIYETGLDKNAANFAQLTPLSFIERAASVYPRREAVVYGAVRRTWAETYARTRQLADALIKRGMGPGDTVSVVAGNIPEMFEAHFGVPMSGAVLNTINTRLDAEAIAFILVHAEAKVVIVDPEFSEVTDRAVKMTGRSMLVVDILDPTFKGGRRVGGITYDELLAEGNPDAGWRQPDDEWAAISLNYTSGTTGDPKGVVYHHRGAFLNAAGNIITWGMPAHPRYLWTLPMFHCNGWCFPWTVAMLGGTHVCLRRVEARAILDAMRDHGVDHYCAAPIVHNLLIHAPSEWHEGITQKVRGMVAGAAPPAAMIEGMARLGFDITHVYGLTEVYGPAAVAVQRAGWAQQSLSEQTRLNGRQGVRYPLQEGMAVLDAESLAEVPADGQTMGEIMFRGNLVMKGYLKNPAATDKAFAGGWFHTGDLAILDSDRYAKIKDRSKDIIISGGENISSIEVEDALYRHAAVMACAVVARPDPRWGETPLAFVELKPGATVSAEELMAHCKGLLAGYKVPREFRFEAIPKTSTGKIQKFQLRERARSASAIE